VFTPLSIRNGISCWLNGREKVVAKQQLEHRKKKIEAKRTTNGPIAVSNTFNLLGEIDPDEEAKLTELRNVELAKVCITHTHTHILDV